MNESKLFRTIDGISEWVGRIAAFGYLIILLIQIMEVILRYIFNSPTIWAWDVNAQLFVGASILGGSYVLLHDAHVKVDVLYGRVGRRTKAMFDLISFPLVILALALLTWQLSDLTWESWKIKEHGWSLFAPPLYPIKTVYLIGVFLLLLQAIAYVCRSLRSLRRQDPAEEGEP